MLSRRESDHRRVIHGPVSPTCSHGTPQRPRPILADVVVHACSHGTRERPDGPCFPAHSPYERRRSRTTEAPDREDSPPVRR